MIEYYKLFDLLNRMGKKKTDLVKDKIISSPTLAKLSKGQNIQTDVIDKICLYLNCQPDKIMEVNYTFKNGNETITVIPDFEIQYEIDKENKINRVIKKDCSSIITNGPLYDKNGNIVDEDSSKYEEEAYKKQNPKEFENLELSTYLPYEDKNIILSSDKKIEIIKNYILKDDPDKLKKIEELLKK